MVQVLRTVVAFAVAPIAAVAVFGLVLALAWLPASPVDEAYRLGAVYAAAALGFAAGGFFAGLLGARARMVHGVVFGLVFGAYALVYVLGFAWLTLVHLVFAVGLSGLGAWVATRVGVGRPAAR